MDGVSDAGLRMQQIAAQLAALRSGSSPALRSATPSNASTAAAGSTLGGSLDATAGGSADGISGAPGTPTSFSSVLASALAGRAGAAGTTTTASLSTSTASLTVTPDTAAIAAPAAGPSSPPAAVPAALRAVGGLSSTGVPTDLSHYGNGRIPGALLKSLGTGDHKLWAPAADNFNAMRAAAARDGVRLGVNDSYRSYTEQVDMARRKGLYSQGGLAAKPGTSDHGWGKSVDLSLDGRALSWMRTHAGQYGFTANVPRESWHWTYKPR